MPRSSRVTLLLLAVVLFVAASSFTGRPVQDDGQDGRLPAVVSDERLRELRSRVEREAARDEAAGYLPATAGRIDDLAVPPEGILRGLPGVAAVDVAVRPAKPARRIVHLRDLHLVPRDLFALDVRQAAGRPLSEAEVGKLYEEHLLETELVQVEQLALLRCLARRHGLRQVRIEGLTAKEVTPFRERIEASKEIKKGEDAARRQLGEVRDLMRAMGTAGREGTDGHRQAAAIERDLLGLIGQSRPLLLEVGAAGRLVMNGEIGGVLPLDDEAALDQANPVTPGGRIRIDAAKVRRREDAMVRAALDGGPFALVVLGGAHDLSDSVRRIAGGDCEYIRVTTKAYREFQGR